MTRRDDPFPFPVERERTQVLPDGTEVPAPPLPVPTPGPGLPANIADALRAAQANATQPRPELPPQPATGRYVLYQAAGRDTPLFRLDTWTGRTWYASMVVSPASWPPAWHLITELSAD